MALETIGAATGTSSGTVVTADAAANTKGAWVELVASTGITCNELALYLLKISAAANFLIDIGTGGAGAETVVLSNLHMSEGGPGRGGSVIALPITIPSGTRIAARCQASVGGSTCTLMGIINNNLSYGSPAWTTYGANTGTSRGTQIDPGATVDTKGAWVELTASSIAAKRIALLLGNQANATDGTSDFLIDIGTGGAGSEVVQIANIPMKALTTDDNKIPHMHIFPLTISGGTRIAVRAQSSTSDAADRLFDVVLLLSDVTEPSGGGGGGPMYLLGGGGF
ncbi:MAG: hypothetical protein H5T84_10300, partial [Thermoleophilia bacterium]|nr:hypothetical protein [Thermoleophilia bacterium]